MPRDDRRPEFTIELEGVGTFNNVESWRINSSFLTPTDSWEVVVFDPKDPGRLRRTFRPWRPVKLYIDGNLQIIGRIYYTVGTGDGEKALRVSGRDYISDLMDPGIDPAVRVKKNESLAQAILTAFEPWHVDSVIGNFDSMRNATTGKNPFTGTPARDFLALKVEDFKPGDGDGPFEWANKLAARHGASIQPSIARNEICLCEPEYQQGPLYQLSRPGNIKSATAPRDWTDVPTVTIAKGRSVASGSSASGLSVTMPSFSEGSPSELYRNSEIQATLTGPNNGVAVIEEVYDPKNKVHTLYDSPAPCYRPMFYSDKQSKSREQLERGLRRMLSERLRKTLIYRCQLRGVYEEISGAIFGVDTVATVKDEIEDVEENLWIIERTLSQQSNGVPMTELELIRPGSLVL